MKTATALSEGVRVACYDCGAPYGDEAWIEAVVANDVWTKISPTGDEGGILCLWCMDRRCASLGIDTTARLLFGGTAIRGAMYGGDCAEAWEEMREILGHADRPDITWLPDLLRERIATPTDSAVESPEEAPDA